jgi:hypothetical protein
MIALERAFKVICCFCGYIHIHHNLDEPKDVCEECNEVLSIDSSWDPHAVRIYVENADPKLIKSFIEEIKSKRVRLGKKKKTEKKKLSSRAARKVA